MNHSVSSHTSGAERIYHGFTRISILSRSGLSTRLMRRVIVTTINSIVFHGAKTWGRGQQDCSERERLLLNSQARAIINMLFSTPIFTLVRDSLHTTCKKAARPPSSRVAVRALSAPRDYPTHQLLPSSIRIGQLYRHKGTEGTYSSCSGKQLLTQSCVSTDE
jgi:hypothetical protein